jgi:hypothetical protein
MLFGLSYLRIGIYAAGLALIGYLAWREHSLVRQVAEIRVERDAERDKVKAYEIADQVDAEVAKELNTFRVQQHADFKAFNETVKAEKITREVRYVSAEGDPIVCVERDRALYRRLHNEAVTGSADP